MIYKEIVKQLKDFDDLLLYNLESEIKKEFERRKTECFDTYSIPLTTIQENKIITLNKKYIPQVDELMLQEKIIYGNNNKKKEVGGERGVYNNFVKLYWDDMVIIYDFLFQELNILIAEKNYFTTKAGF